MKIWCVVALGVLLGGCSHPGGATQAEPIRQSHRQYDKQFAIWQQTQRPELIREYEVYLKRHLMRAPSLFELAFNAYTLNAECERFRFAIPPREEWKNLVPTLKLLEKLKTIGVIEQTRIISVYRAKEANHCTHDHYYQYHQHNAAIDFQALTMQGQTDKAAVARLCEFWRTYGKRYKMGLAVYSNQVIHIDTQGYRSWGDDFNPQSSVCI